MASFLLYSMIHIFPITVIIHEVLHNSASPMLAHAGSFSRADFTLVPLTVLQMTWWAAFPKENSVSRLWQEWKFVKTPKKNKNHMSVLHWNSISCYFPDPFGKSQELEPGSKLPQKYLLIISLVATELLLPLSQPPCYSMLSPMPQRGRSLLSAAEVGAWVWIPDQTPIL